MSSFAVWIEVNGMVLLQGATIILLIGAAAVCLTRTPVWKQRMAELSVLMTLIWVALASLPLPRIAVPETVRSTPVAVTQAESALLLQLRDAPAPINTEQTTSKSSSNAPAQFSGLEQVADATSIVSVVKEPTLSKELASQIYLCCSIAMIAWLTLVRVYLHWQIRARVGAPEWLHDAYTNMPRSRDADLVVSHRVRRPMSYGILNPKIALPEELCLEESVSTVSHVLKHEQVHVDRRDAIGNFVLNLAMPLLWFHPVYWFLRRQAQFSRELIADDCASAGCKQDYISALINMIESLPSQRGLAPAEIGAFGLKHPFSKRMVALAQRDQPLDVGINFRRGSLLSMASLSGVVLLAALMGGVQTAKGVDAPVVQLEAESDQKARENEDGNPEPVLASNNDQLADEAVVKHCVIEASNRRSMYAPDDATIREILVKPGQRVEKGEVLIRLENSQLNAEAVTAKFQIRSLRDRLDSLTTVRSSKVEPEINSLKLELEHAQAKYDSVEGQLGRLTITAPISGVVDGIRSSKGTPVARGHLLATVTNLESVRINGHLDVTRIVGLDLAGKKASAEIRLPDASSTMVTGSVAYLSTDVDINGFVEVWIECQNIKVQDSNQWVLRPGMPVDEVQIGGKDQQRNLQGENDENARPSELLAESTPQQNEANFRTEEAMLLEKMISVYEDTSKFARLNFEAGIGTMQEYQSAEADTKSVKARLATLQGDVDKAGSLYQEAIADRKQAVAAKKAEYRSGSGSATSFGRESTRLLELQMEYLKFRKSQIQKLQQNLKP